MKTADVKIGRVYLTRIAGALAPVVVTAEAPRRRKYGASGSEDRDVGPARFRVARVHGATLPLPRSAAALREVPDTIFHMKDQPWAVRVTRDYALSVEPKRYNVAIPDFDFGVCGVEAKDPVAAAVLTARGMIARAVFGEARP